MKRVGAPLNFRQWPQIAAVASAGVLTFAVAAMLGSRPARDGDTASDLVLPAERVRPGSDYQGAHAPAGTGATALVLQRIDRLNDNVTHNPFAALNLHAASAAQAPASQAVTKTPVSLNKRSVKSPEPTPTPTPPTQPPPPMAPPLPFTAVGSIAGAQVGDGRPVAFVRQQDRLLLVRAGDAIGQSWLVDSVTADKIEFTYLPLMQRQVLQLAP